MAFPSAVPTLKEFMVKTFVPNHRSEHARREVQALLLQGGWKLLAVARIDDETRLEDMRLDHITLRMPLEIPHSGFNQNMALRTLRWALSWPSRRS